jgi:hypothetical protein
LELEVAKLCVGENAIRNGNPIIFSGFVDNVVFWGCLLCFCNDNIDDICFFSLDDERSLSYFTQQLVEVTAQVRGEK